MELPVKLPKVAKVSEWTPLTDMKPVDGDTVCVWSIAKEYDIATYYQGDFYKLEMDNTVGCLRKNPVGTRILSWCHIQMPS